MATTPTGLTVPAGTDAFDPDGDMRTLAGSLEGRIIVPVPNVTARDALAAALSPSPAEPLIVRRIDTGIIEECTGLPTWRPIAGVTAPALLPLVTSDWSHRDGRAVQWYQDGPNIVIQGSFVSKNAGVTSTALFAVGTLPVEARPARVENSVGMALSGTVLGLVEIHPTGEVVAKIATPTANLPVGAFDFAINTHYRRAT